LNLTRKKCFAKEKRGFFAQKSEKRGQNGEKHVEN